MSFSIQIKKWKKQPPRFKASSELDKEERKKKKPRIKPPKSRKLKHLKKRKPNQLRKKKKKNQKTKRLEVMIGMLRRTKKLVTNSSTRIKKWKKLATSIILLKWT